MFPASTKKKKGGISIAFPDVCKTPAPPAPFVPIPYPNISMASSNLKTASAKITKYKSKFEGSQGDEPGTAKGIATSMSKISGLFSKHSATVKATGKKMTKPMLPNQAAKVFDQAKKQQKTFEAKVKKECEALIKACKDNAEDKDQLKQMKEVVSKIGSAARGHPI